MKQALAVLMIVGFLESLASADRGAKSGEISFEAVPLFKLKLDCREELEICKHRFALSSPPENIEIAKEAFRYAKTDSEKLSVILVMNDKITGVSERQPKSFWLTSNPLNAGELKNWYKTLSGGETLPDTMIDAYLVLLGENEINVREAQGLGFISAPGNIKPVSSTDAETYFSTSQIINLDISCINNIASGCAVESRDIFNSPNEIDSKTNPTSTKATQRKQPKGAQ